MKRGEKVVLVLIGLVLFIGVLKSLMHVEELHDKDIPFYSTSNSEVAAKAMDIYRDNGCKNCHTLWTLRNMLQNVPAPMLDGIGSLRSETWLFEYLSADNPQKLLPSRLKKEYQMPSYAKLTIENRQILSNYLSSLKVKDWYLEETKNAEIEKLTGVELKK